MTKWWGLALGSLAGGFARYLLTGFTYRFVRPTFPYGTLLVNLSGCLLIGLFDSLAEDKFLLGPDARILLMTGFCGAYTTFSTLILETSHLLKEGEVLSAASNLGLSLVLGFVLFRVGGVLGEMF